MYSKSRILVAAGSIILVLVFLFPIWKISLSAPQYPEGIGLNIWVNKITGENPHDLSNINRLNHYIGMKEIEPDAIPELKIMPYVVGFLIVLGLSGTFWNKRVFLIIWLVLFLTFSVVGLMDFYNWEYDYGHNLDPDAPIKVPGMTYQPPLIGSKQLLNINAKSYPGTGGIAALISFVVGFGALILDFRSRKTKAD